MLNLTGPGGTGKTRLALEAASSLVPSYKAGVFWVGLASLRDPALVIGDDRPDTRRQGRSRLPYRRERDAPPPRQPRAGDRRSTRALIASQRLSQPHPPRHEPRAPTHPGGGRVPGAAPRLTGRRLPLLRARADKPTEEIADLCTRLDSLPLAVELAAARVKALSPAQILERLSSRLDLLKGGRDADPRQQTLRATIEWSYELLSLGRAAAPWPSLCLRGRLHARSRRSRWRDVDSTPCSRSSRRAFCVSSISATGCSRRSGSTPGNGLSM